MTLYELSGVQKCFGGVPALDVEHLALPENTACALLGPNGSGKTTLLHILALLTPPSAGTIHFMGEPVGWRANRLLSLRRKVVLVEQHPIMFSTTVLNNVAYGPKMRGESRSGQKRIAMECLGHVGLSDFAGRPAHHLSGGETQRAAIARALACRPEVLLLDEPTAGVDVENQALVEHIVFHLCNDKNISVIFSTHNVLQAERLARKKVFLNAGRVTSPPAENRFPMSLARQNGFLASVVKNSANGKAVSNLHPNGSVISIDPEKIRIYPAHRDQPAFDNNRFSARVLQMNAEGKRIRVVLDVNGDAGGPGGKVLVNAIVFAEDARKFPMIPGDAVQITLDCDAAAVFHPGKQIKQYR